MGVAVKTSWSLCTERLRVNLRPGPLAPRASDATLRPSFLRILTMSSGRICWPLHACHLARGLWVRLPHHSRPQILQEGLPLERLCHFCTLPLETAARREAMAGRHTGSFPVAAGFHRDDPTGREPRFALILLDRISVCYKCSSWLCHEHAPFLRDEYQGGRHCRAEFRKEFGDSPMQPDFSYCFQTRLSQIGCV